jgi:hypothetical protein
MENKVRLTTILWLKYFSYIVILVIFIISLFNFIINPYGLFPHSHKLNTIKNHILSDRMTQYYNFKHNKPNVIMMGTSRIGLYPSNYLEKYFPKTSKISNMALAGSSIYEQSAYLKSYIQEPSYKE